MLEFMTSSREDFDPGAFCVAKSFVVGRGGPLQGPERGLLSNTQKRIVWADMCWQSKRFYWERSTWAESSRVREPRRTALPRGSQSRVLWDEMSFQVVFGQSLWLRVLPGGARTAQPIWMPAREILGSGRTRGVPFWPFPNASGWWWLISSVFLIRTSCPKTTHANGY